MKRRTKRKLELERTTIRRLRAADLDQANGGGYGFTCNRYNCGNETADCVATQNCADA